MKIRPIQSFLGFRALIVHPACCDLKILSDQLVRLGLEVETRFPVEELTADHHDVIFFDVDRGFDQQFGWPKGEPPVPLIALMGSEAPGRLEWALSQMPAAYLVKPLRPNGIFAALAIAHHTYSYRTMLTRKIADLNDRIRARPSVVTAIGIVQSFLSIDPESAFEFLRSEAMNQQLSVEKLCEQVAVSGSLAPLQRLTSRNTARAAKTGHKEPRSTSWTG